MKTMTFVGALLAIVVSSVILSGCSKPAASATTAPATSQASVSGPPVNKYCAVQGSPNEVDPTVFIIYKGQKIGFCCSDCIKDFKKNPDKYIASMK